MELDDDDSDEAASSTKTTSPSSDATSSSTESTANTSDESSYDATRPDREYKFFRGENAEDSVALVRKINPPPKGVGGFGSHHIRGAHFAAGSGKVQFIHESIDPRLFAKMCNRHDAELVTPAQND